MVVLYWITLIPLAEELRVTDPVFLSLLYADNAAFRDLERQSAQLLKLLMERGPYRGYLPDPAKSLFILDKLGQDEAPKREFSAERLVLNSDSGSWYLWAYLGP